ncbi:MAG TPA: 6-aminohexanoate hydrolase [Alphaproteobacteria bacterium]|nr:6-aminohexanoate hydrolase [Alphaproteobacteria bacterium]
MQPSQPTDPVALHIMQGFPPEPKNLVRLQDGSGYIFPKTRWAFSHQRELVPTATIRRGPAPAFSFSQSPRSDIDTIGFTTLDGRPMSWAQGLIETETDGILILHRGRIIYERYFGALTPERPHMAFSVTKSFVGLIAAMLQHQGALDPNQLTTHYVPELASTAYADATVRQVMDMTVGVRYSETYTDPTAEIWAYASACGVIPRAPNYQGPQSIFAFLQTLQKEGAHDEAFAYKTCNTEVLGWIVQRLTGTTFATLVSDWFWQQLGTEEDAYVVVDGIGAAMCGGGLNTTLRDLARFGEMMRRHGALNGRQLVPEAVVADITRGADRDHFAKAGYQTLPGWSYRHQWWISHNNLGAYSARGIHGQAIWIAPSAELVIVRYASHPTAANGNGPLDYISLPAYQAVADHLLRA